MNIISEIRCFDCLHEFEDGARFVVNKEDKSQRYSDEERQLGGHLYQVWVCEDCSQWYDDAVELERP